MSFTFREREKKLNLTNVEQEEVIGCTQFECVV